MILKSDLLTNLVFLAVLDEERITAPLSLPQVYSSSVFLKCLSVYLSMKLHIMIFILLFIKEPRLLYLGTATRSAPGRLPPALPPHDPRQPA